MIGVNHMTDALVLLKEFCVTAFEQRDSARMLSILTRDVRWFGTSDEENVCGIDAARSHGLKLMGKTPRGYKVSFADECLMPTGGNGSTAFLSATIAAENVAETIRVTGSAREEDGEIKLCAIHLSASNGKQSGENLSARLARRSDAKIKQELMNSAIAGGMMGGYAEEGFPFYFINEHALKYLGYASEKEFVDDIGGMIENCIHPDDRTYVNAQTYSQLAAGDSYSVEYRMRTKRGDYLWVRDFGRKIIAEDGRDAIISICYDITELKSKEFEVKAIINSNGSGMAVYEVMDGYLLPVFLSENVAAFAGYTNEEYTQLVKKDTMAAIFSHDHTIVENAIASTMKTGEATNVTFRVICKNGGFTWLNAVYSRQNGREGKKLLRAVFTCVSKQFEMQTNILNETPAAIYVIDPDTYELYYINRRGFEIYEKEPCDYIGQTCHGLLNQTEHLCSHCKLAASIETGEQQFITMEKTGRVYTLTSKKADWLGKPAIIEYVNDVTEQMQTQQQLHDVVHNVPGGICLYKWNGERLLPIVVSDKLGALLGTDAHVSLENARGLDFIHTHPDDAAGLKKAIYAALYETGKIEYVYRSKNDATGEWIWILLQGNVIEQDDGTKLAYVSYTDVTSSKITEEKLRASEMELEVATDQKNMWFWTFDAKTDTIHTYPRLRRDFDLPEYLGDFPQAWLSRGFVLPEYHQIYTEMLERIKNGESQVEFETRVRFKDGSVHWVLYRIKNVFDENGEVYVAVGMGEIIDTLKTLQARIELEEKRPSYGEENMLQYVVFNLTKNKLERYSDTLLRAKEGSKALTVECAAKIVAKDIPDKKQREEYLEFHDVEKLIFAYENGATEHTMESRRLQKDGSLMWVRNFACTLRDPATSCLMMFEYSYNIQDEKIEQTAIESLVTNGYEYIVINDAKNNTGKTLKISADYDDVHYSYFEDVDGLVTGYILQNCIDENKEEIAKALTLENIVKQLKDKTVYTAYYTVRDKSGRPRRKKVTYAIVDEENMILCQTRSDVTDIFEAEQKRSEALKKALLAAEQATRAKSEFLSRMSHEIRTPMNAIMGMTAIAMDNRSDCGQMSECLEKIDMSSNYLLTLINDILEMSRIESGKVVISRREFSFEYLMSSVATIVETLAAKSGVEYQFIENAKPDAQYFGDMMRVQQVLVNILSNAVKFTKSGGKVKFTVDIESETDDETHFCFTVADTGIGISKKFMPKLFEPFTQENNGTTSMYGGSGLGLAISRSIITEMGGSIDVESRENVGTTFTIRLPLRRAAKATETQQSEAPAPQKRAAAKSLKGCRVLLAEDHPLNITVATKLLERQGVTAEVAENGKIAVDMFARSEAGYYDMILMDIRMPVMDGIDAAKAIRLMPRPDAQNIPLIAMTANALDEDKKKTLSAGMNAHLSKPIEPKVLYETVGEFYGGEK